ncbi:MAG: UDP-N-acetylmuramate--L-alanine ligase [Candidatus Pacebacteria bacterium]|nr:UDP-N-acetylmuramate--L-alanine ligase [Candidatus Paceibacterota bacterium]
MKISVPKVGTIHFVGIGGIGMSGIAEILNNLGYSISGSDLAENSNVLRLRGLGIRVAIGHRAENIVDAEFVVVTSAAKADNPEIREAKARHIPIVRRAEMLAELMRLKSSIAVAGTHGKTTTTSMVAALLAEARLDPTVINGGIINSLGTNAHLGSGDWIVVEADESDGSFIKLPATVGIITNIDPEHLDYYGSFDNIVAAFTSFVQNLPFYGFAVLCIDHPTVQEIIPRLSDRRIVTYGLSPLAEVRGVNLQLGSDGAQFDVSVRDRKTGERRLIPSVKLPMYGEHNICNALAAMAVAMGLGIDDATIVQGLANFTGVLRRFTRTGVANGIVIIDDYGHHPVEITAVLKAARTASKGRVIAVVQPHRYTRLRDLFTDFCLAFNDADAVIVAPVYPAGESPIEGVSGMALAEGLRNHGHREVTYMDHPDQLAEMVHVCATTGDLVVCLGAGSITNWAYELPKSLERIQSKTK